MTIDPCKDESLLSALVDDELSAEASAEVQQHVESCPLCRKRFEEFQKADSMVRNMPHLEPSRDFDRVFWQKIAGLENREKSRFRLSSILIGWRTILATGMAAAVIATIFIYTGQHKKFTQEEALIAQNIDLLEDYDVIDQLDILENWDDLESMKEPS